VEAVDAIAVDPTGPQSGNEDAPIMVLAVPNRIEADRSSGRFIGFVEEKKLDSGRVLREQAEVDAGG
jgi:hypothetical protein